MKLKKFILYILGAIFLLTVNGCGPSIPGPSVRSIKHVPDTPREGDDVVFTITYENTNETETFDESILEVTFDPDLIYRKSLPDPDQIDIEQHSLNWSLGPLQPGDGGKIEITFQVDYDFPLEKFLLDIDAKITSKTIQGTSVAKTGSGSTYVLGHYTPTPIPTPTNTPSSDTSNPDNPTLFQTFEQEGVRVELPWQGQELNIRQGDFETGLLQDPVQDGYEIIRPVINFDVIDTADNVIHRFDPPMNVTVNYTAQDIEKSGDPNNLILLIHDSQQESWIPYNTEINTTEMTGLISISDWTSYICWGR